MKPRYRPTTGLYPVGSTTSDTASISNDALQMTSERACSLLIVEKRPDIETIDSWAPLKFIFAIRENPYRLAGPRGDRGAGVKADKQLVCHASNDQRPVARPGGRKTDWCRQMCGIAVRLGGPPRYDGFSCRSRSKACHKQIRASALTNESYMLCYVMLYGTPCINVADTLRPRPCATNRLQPTSVLPQTLLLFFGKYYKHIVDRRFKMSG